MLSGLWSCTLGMWHVNTTCDCTEGNWSLLWYGVSFNKLQNSDSCVTSPVGFSTIYGFSQACSFLIVVRKDEICPSRQLCIFYWSMFISKILFGFVGRFLLSLWQCPEVTCGSDLPLSWKSRGGKRSGILWGIFLFPSWNHRSQHFCKMTKVSFSLGVLDFPYMCSNCARTWTSHAGWRWKDVYYAVKIP